MAVLIGRNRTKSWLEITAFSVAFEGFISLTNLVLFGFIWFYSPLRRMGYTQNLPPSIN